MSFEYKQNTKEHYQSDDVAESYNNEFTALRGINGLRFRFIAKRERQTLLAMLSRFPGSSVLDIPTGTGKMAPVFSALDCKVVACDISPNMLAIAQKAFERVHKNVYDFRVIDLEDASNNIDERFDVVVCIRLMHRVPDEIKVKMLAQISTLAPHAIVSFGIDSAYHRTRSALRSKLIGGLDVGKETRKSIQQTEKILGSDFNILDRKRIAGGLSSEIFFLLESKAKS